MKGDAQPLIKFFDGSDKRFIIPLYQRNYDWKEENCEQLFQDLMKLHNSDRRSHFFGSIVSSIQSGTEDRFIIDGQQRITTVSLLLIAMVNAKKEGLVEATDAKLVEKIFIFNRTSSNIAHRVKTVLFEFSSIAFAPTPKIGEWTMRPKRFTVGHFNEFSNTYAVFIGRYVLCYNIHSNFCKVKICTNTGCGGNSGHIKYI